MDKCSAALTAPINSLECTLHANAAHRFHGFGKNLPSLDSHLTALMRAKRIIYSNDAREQARQRSRERATKDGAQKKAGSGKSVDFSPASQGNDVDIMQSNWTNIICLELVCVFVRFGNANRTAKCKCVSCVCRTRLVSMWIVKSKCDNSRKWKTTRRKNVIWFAFADAHVTINLANNQTANRSALNGINWMNRAHKLAEKIVASTEIQAPSLSSPMRLKFNPQNVPVIESHLFAFPIQSTRS